MKIKKVFNNNTVATISLDNTEMIVIGPGIGFQKKIGDELNESKIEKRYVIEKPHNARFYQMLEKIPVEYFEISEIIFKKAWKEFEGGLSSQMVLTLTDHIAFSLQRQKDQIQVPNLLLPEIRTLYPKEYKIGVWAIKYIALKTGITLPIDEAGFIAMHIINWQMNENGNSAEEILSFSKQIIHLIEVSMEVNLHNSDFNATRLITHLKYLANRVFSKERGKVVGEFDQKMYQMMLGMNPKMKKCLDCIYDYIKRDYGYELSSQELFYIMIHILKILN